MSKCYYGYAYCDYAVETTTLADTAAAATVYNPVKPAPKYWNTPIPTGSFQVGTSPRKSSMFPTWTEIQDWQKTYTNNDWVMRTGGLPDPDSSRAYLDMASEIYALVGIIDVMAQTIAQLQHPSGGNVTHGTSPQGSGQTEACYWCGSSRLSNMPCPQCKRP